MNEYVSEFLAIARGALIDKPHLADSVVSSVDIAQGNSVWNKTLIHLVTGFPHQPVSISSRYILKEPTDRFGRRNKQTLAGLFAFQAGPAAFVWKEETV